VNQPDAQDLLPPAQSAFCPQDAPQASAWITVLEACRIEHQLEYVDSNWLIHVDPLQFSTARHHIEAMEAEGDLLADFASPLGAIPESERSLSSWWVAAFLLAFYVWLGPYQDRNPILLLASSNAEAFAAGEWWRPITALTIHSDEVHIGGNLICIVLLGAAVCDRFGGGLAWIIILGAGIFGNVLACLMHGTDYISVGASTSAFGALGALSADSAVRRWRQSTSQAMLWKQSALPIAAGSALVGLLGTGPRSDLAAHIFGFLMGAVLAVLCKRWITSPPKYVAVLQMGALVVVLLAWRSAFEASLY
jgi:rhomboid protease GluP